VDLTGKTFILNLIKMYLAHKRTSPRCVLSINSVQRKAIYIKMAFKHILHCVVSASASLLISTLVSLFASSCVK